MSRITREGEGKSSLPFNGVGGSRQHPHLIILSGVPILLNSNPPTKSISYYRLWRVDGVGGEG